MDIEKAQEKFTPEILSAMAEIQQPRSRFQLDKFVINQHDTEEMRYFQCILELQTAYYGLKHASLNYKKNEIKIARLRATGDEIDEIDAQIAELGLEQTRLQAIGSIRELEHLVDIFNSFDKKYTRDEIEIGQIEYWNKRLHRQAMLEAVGGSQAQASHLDALRQAGMIEVTDEGVKQIESNLSEIKLQINQ